MTSTLETDPPTPETAPPVRRRRIERRGFVARWDRHPSVPSGDQLTLGERAADAMRNGMGSWNFVFVFIAMMAAWAIANSVFYLFGQHGKHGFDPYPYILLNLFLSMVAGLQGAILLIAAKRSDQIASQLAEHDYATDMKASERIEAIHERLEEFAVANRQLLEQNTALLRQIAESVSK